MKFTEKTRKQIKERAEGKCERCGGYIASDSHAHIHHRKPRGMGGTKQHGSRTTANGLFLHPSCHYYIENHRKESKEMGFILGQTEEPILVPVFTFNGWVLLDLEGGLSKIETAWVGRRGEAEINPSATSS